MTGFSLQPGPRRAFSAFPGAQRERGVALAILVWFLAAMALLIGGIAMQARVDIKLTQLHAERARVEAIADGAIQLALVQMLLQQVENTLDAARPFTFSYAEGSLSVQVELVPLTGLVDINLAPEELLFKVFAAVGDIDEAQALILAANVVEWRSALGGEASAVTGDKEARGEDERTMRHARFEAIEDLLLVPGVDRRIFEAVREAVYVSQRGQAGVDWQAAPPVVLKAVGGLTDEQVKELAERDPGDSIAPAELDLAFQQREGLTLYRADARVGAGGQTYLRRRWVERGSPGADRLPWRFFRTEPVRAMGLTAQASGPESEND